MIIISYLSYMFHCFSESIFPFVIQSWFKSYLKLSPLHQTLFIKSWSKHYAKNGVVYRLSTFVNNNWNAPTEWVRIPDLIWNKKRRLFTKINSLNMHTSQIKYATFTTIKCWTTALPIGNYTLEYYKRVPPTTF